MGIACAAGLQALKMMVSSDLSLGSLNDGLQGLPFEYLIQRNGSWNL